MRLTGIPFFFAHRIAVRSSRPMNRRSPSTIAMRPPKGLSREKPPSRFSARERYLQYRSVEVFSAFSWGFWLLSYLDA